MYPIKNPSLITQITNNITASTNTITIITGSILPDAPNIATIFNKTTTESETILYTGKVGNTLSGITRGFVNTVPQAWPAGTDITRALSNYDHDTFIENIEILNNKIDEIDISGGGEITKVQSDWEQEDNSKPDYVKNRPKINNITLKGNRSLPEEPIPNTFILSLFNK